MRKSEQRILNVMGDFEWWTSRQVADVSGYSIKLIYQTLVLLVEEGLVQRATDGATMVYRRIR